MVTFKKIPMACTCSDAIALEIFNKPRSVVLRFYLSVA